MNTIPLSSSLSSRRSATGTSTGKETTGSQHVLKDYLKRRNLILALIRREIERLSTWHNPMARPELSFTGVESLVNWANQTVFTERIRRDLVRLAFHISPLFFYRQGLFHLNSPFFSTKKRFKPQTIL